MDFPKNSYALVTSGDYLFTTYSEIYSLQLYMSLQNQDDIAREIKNVAREIFGKKVSPPVETVLENLKIYTQFFSDPQNIAIYASKILLQGKRDLAIAMMQSIGGIPASFAALCDPIIPLQIPDPISSYDPIKLVINKEFMKQLILFFAEFGEPKLAKDIGTHCQISEINDVINQEMFQSLSKILRDERQTTQLIKTIYMNPEFHKVATSLKKRFSPKADKFLPLNNVREK